MAEDQMLAEHRRQWHGFVKLIAWCLAAIITTLVLTAIFLL